MTGLNDQRIVCISSIHLGFIPTSRHHLARHLARTNDVLFVDPPGNVLRRGTGGSSGSDTLVARGPWGALYAVEPRLWRLRPTPRLPYGGTLRFRLLTPINQRIFPWSVKSALTQLRWRHPILWDVAMTYLTPRMAGAIAPAAHVIHLTDDLWSYPWYRSAYDDFLRQELSTCQLAIGSTPELVERLDGFGVEAHHLPHGADLDRFGPVAEGEVEPHPSLVDAPRPRLGFVGNLEARLDLTLLEALAGGSGSLTMVGPVNISPRARERLERAGCSLVGPVPFEEVPSWLAGFDIALVPYRLTELVRRSRPLKLLDYLAAGCPVVSIDIPAARELHPHVKLAVSHANFLDAVAETWDQRNVELGSTARRQRRAAIAGESWTTRGAELEALFERALEIARRRRA
jgi:glycosyltransferase involved in cell wall biosynthesis